MTGRSWAGTKLSICFYVSIIKSSAKHFLLDVPSWTQNSYSLDVSPPSRLAQMVVSCRKETCLLPGLVQPLSEQENIPHFSFWFYHLTLLLPPTVSRLSENSALGTADEGEDFIEVKFYYTNGLSKAFLGK